MFDEALKTWSTSGVDAVMEFLNNQENQVETAETYHKLEKELYWQQKNVPDMVVVAQAGIDYGLSAAEQVDAVDPEMAYDLRSWAKSIAYDLASFTWRGWDESGMEITAADEAAGMRAAVLNLRLANELKKGPLRVSRAYWVLGAQQLATAEFAQAEMSFRAGAEQAALVSAESDARMCHAYAALATCLRKPDDEVLLARLAAANRELLEVEDGGYFVEQVQTAQRVFGK